MAATKILTLSILILGMTGPLAQAAPTMGGSWRWSTWTKSRGVTPVVPRPNSPPIPASPVPPTPVPVPTPTPNPTPVPPATPAEPPGLAVMSRWAQATQNSVITKSQTDTSNANYNAQTFTALSSVDSTGQGNTTSLYQADAFVNLTDGPFADAGLLTIGGAQPWYTSPTVEKVFGSVPNAEQRVEFTQAVLDHVQQTFDLSGVPVKLTDDPNVPAAHTLSVVSNTHNAGSPDGIGVTSMGGNGFSFIDALQPYADTVDHLEWAVAHNVAHELMHAFDVEHHDGTGQYLDAPASPWSVLADANTVFGPDAVNDLLTKNFTDTWLTTSSMGLERVDTTDIAPQPVPEPTTLALWGLAGFAALAVRRIHRNRKAA